MNVKGAKFVVRNEGHDVAGGSRCYLVDPSFSVDRRDSVEGYSDLRHWMPARPQSIIFTLAKGPAVSDLEIRSESSFRLHRAQRQAKREFRKTRNARRQEAGDGAFWSSIAFSLCRAEAKFDEGIDAAGRFGSFGAIAMNDALFGIVVQRPVFQVVGRAFLDRNAGRNTFRKGFTKGRIIDVTTVAARSLGFTGLTQVDLTVLIGDRP